MRRADRSASLISGIFSARDDTSMTFFRRVGATRQAPPLQLVEADLYSHLIAQDAGPEWSTETGKNRDDMAIVQSDPARSQRKQAGHHAVEGDLVIAKRDDVALARHRKAAGGFLAAAGVQLDLKVELLSLVKRSKLGHLHR